MPEESPVPTYDYVVVGGGTAGAVVAARLTEDPAVTVCVLEAGPSDVGDDSVLRLDRWMALLESGYDWDYPVEPQENGNSFMRHARAKVLGGCSSHNSCIAFWAPAEDLDEWGALGCTGWSAADCFPLYKRLETNDAPGDHHGRSGPVTLRTVPADDPCGTALLAACAEAGIPTTPFNTGTTVVRGAHWFQINAREDGTRSSASVSYLHPILGKRPSSGSGPTWSCGRASRPSACCSTARTGSGAPGWSTWSPTPFTAAGCTPGARWSSPVVRSTPPSC
ncbi:Oxygen-dependent choline dehydrogenase [Streptomyces microflavus]